MQSVIPTLRVTNYEQSKRFYTQGLKFNIDWEHRFEPGLPVFCQISRDSRVLYLSEHRGDCQPGGLVYLFVTDVETWYRELSDSLPPVRAGLSRLQGPPEEGIPGLRSMTVFDPVGNQLRICTWVKG